MSADQLIGVVSDDKAQTTTVEKLQWTNFLLAHLLRHFRSIICIFFFIAGSLHILLLAKLHYANAQHSNKAIAAGLMT